MRVKLHVGILIVLAAMLLLAACGGPSLKGSTWTGDGLVAGNVTLTFMTDSECQLGIRSVGTTGTYTVADDQVSVSLQGQSYTFTIKDDDTMTGYVYGMALTLVRQK
jgi:hypothetical protein